MKRICSGNLRYWKVCIWEPVREISSSYLFMMPCGANYTGILPIPSAWPPVRWLKGYSASNLMQYIINWSYNRVFQVIGIAPQLNYHTLTLNLKGMKTWIFILFLILLQFLWN